MANALTRSTKKTQLAYQKFLQSTAYLEEAIDTARDTFDLEPDQYTFHDREELEENISFLEDQIGIITPIAEPINEHFQQS